MCVRAPSQLHSMLSDDGYQVLEQFSLFVEQLQPVHCAAEQRLPLEMVYQRKMEAILANENCFKLKIVSRPAQIFRSPWKILNVYFVYVFVCCCLLFSTRLVIR